jgi:tripeptide aminopeptidase
MLRTLYLFFGLAFLSISTTTQAQSIPRPKEHFRFNIGNVGVTGGGTSVNAIPFESWMEVDMRLESPERLSAVDAMLQADVQKALAEENQMKRAGKDLTVDVKLVGDRPSGMQDSNLPLIQTAMASASFLGSAPKLSTSSTNSNIPISKGVPVVTIGKGGASGAHTH